jgi:diaminohydroxyphosphoribosylaminopyrimidine deaminase / 5-amino-6-(5-phosphoribosylamino)uracil reductase
MKTGHDQTMTGSSTIESLKEELFAAFAAGTSSKPFVVAQLGQSLDGRIATLSGESKYINGPSALTHLHRLRAEVEAVVIGVGTALADDPLLTVRRCTGKSPARIIIDPSGRMPDSAQVLREDGTRRIIVRHSTARFHNGTETMVLDRDEDGFPPQKIIQELGKLGFSRILIEGGANTISRFIDAGCVDHLHLLIAPVILGSGKPGLSLKPIEHLSQALRPQIKTYALEEGEMLFDVKLR